jgi:hypothetical protein
MTLQTLDQRQAKKRITAVSVRLESARVVQIHGTLSASSTRMERLVFTFSICDVPYVTALPWRLCRHSGKEVN